MLPSYIRCAKVPGGRRQAKFATAKFLLDAGKLNWARQSSIWTPLSYIRRGKVCFQCRQAKFVAQKFLSNAAKPALFLTRARSVDQRHFSLDLRMFLWAVLLNALLATLLYGF